MCLPWRKRQPFNQVTAALRQASSGSKSWKNPKQNSQSGKQETCFGCGREGHRFRSKNCPAVEKECYNCKKKAHFKQMCKSRQSGAQTKNFQKKKNNWQLKKVTENSESNAEDDLKLAIRNVLY